MGGESGSRCACFGNNSSGSQTGNVQGDGARPDHGVGATTVSEAEAVPVLSPALSSVALSSGAIAAGTSYDLNSSYRALLRAGAKRQRWPGRP